MAKYLDKEGLIYLKQKLDALFGKKVDKVEGKGLSTNDYTTDEQSKLAGINAGAQVNKIETIKVNGTAQTITSKAVDIKVPTAVSDLSDASDYAKASVIPSKVSTLTNDSGYQTASQVSSAIATAVGKITSISYSIVTTLPETGKAGVIYLIANSGTGNNIYDEYIYVNKAFEKIGTTEMDLSGYVKSADISEITNTEIDEIFG